MRVTCAFGSRWPCGPCRKCLAYAEVLERAFEREVFFGRYDRQGYTPAERAKHQQRVRA